MSILWNRLLSFFKPGKETTAIVRIISAGDYEFKISYHGGITRIRRIR